jgi:hypothetical protein
MNDNLFTEAFDHLNNLETRKHGFTPEQSLKVAEVKALLAIAQELQIIQEHGINPEYSQRRI